ncbi:MAG: caspase family protein [Phycisphaerae bacterium]|jgi:hypothetical protein
MDARIAAAIIATACLSLFTLGLDSPAPAKQITAELEAPHKIMLKGDFSETRERRTEYGRLDSSDTQIRDGSRADAYTASFSAGDRVVIAMSSTDLDAYVLLVRRTDEGLDTVAEDDDSGPGLDARLEVTIETGGEYLVVANGADRSDRGEYTLTIDVERAGRRSSWSGDDSGTDAPPPVHRGRLSASDDDRLSDGSLFELVYFQGRRGQTLVLTLTSSSFDPVLAIGIVEDDDRTVLTSNDDFGSGNSSRIRIQLPRTGRYFAVVNAYSARESGDYELRIREVEAVERAAPMPSFSTGGSSDGRYALLVGIDDYPGEESDLSSCVIDVGVMRDLLVDRFGFSEENILTLTNNQASRDNIIRGIREFLGQVGPDGLALFYYSGHGAQMDDVGRKDEKDDLDEVLYVWGLEDASSVLVDDEIGALLDELDCDRALAIFDSCHAGSGTLGEDFKAVNLKAPWIQEHLVLPTEYIPSKGDAGEGHFVDSPRHHVLWAGCADDETSRAGVNGRPSVFTRFLVDEIDGNGTRITMREFMDHVRARVHEYVSEKLGSARPQTPQIEGVKLDRTLAQIFGGGA